MPALSSLRLPRARPRDQFVVEEIADEVLVYDNETTRAHCLNRTAAVVWQHCDGTTSIQTVLRALAAAGLPADRAVVELAISQLTKANLVEPAEQWRQTRFRSRRTVLKQIGLMAAASVALPIVQSIVAPSVAEAASKLPSGAPCSGNGNCASGVCIKPPGICA